MAWSTFSPKSRRAFLATLGVGIGSAIVVACGPAASPTPPAAASPPAAATQAPASAPTAAPTSAPTSAATAATPVPTPKPTVASQAAPQAGPVKFAWWSYPLLPSDQWPQGKWEGQLIDTYQKDHSNVQISFLPLTWNMIPKVFAAITAGTPPELLGQGSWAHLLLAKKAGVLQEVTLPDDLAKDLPPGWLDGGRYEGKTYMIPWFIEANGAKVNLTLAKEANAENLLPQAPAYSWNWDQFREFAKAVTSKKNGTQIWGSAIFSETSNPNLHWITWQWLWNLGADMYKDPVNGGCVGLNTPTDVKGLQYLHDLYYVDKVIPDPANVRDTDLGTFWSQGTTAYQTGASTDAAHGKGTTIDKTTGVMTDPKGFQWRFCQNPTQPGAQHHGWGGPGLDDNLVPFRPKDLTDPTPVLDFGFFVVNQPNQEFIAQFMIPARSSAVAAKLGDDPLVQYTFKYLAPGAQRWRADDNQQKLLDIFNTHFQDLWTGKSAQQVANDFAAEANPQVGCTG